MDLITDFAINIGAGIILIVATAVVTWASRALPAKRLWRLKNPERLVVCISTSAKTDTGTYTRLASGIGQIRALAILMPSLSQGYKRVDAQRILMSEDEIADRAEQDLIILGGPKNNKLARDLLSEESLPFRFQEPTLKWMGSGEHIDYSPKYENDNIIEDYGLIVRMRNPHNPAKTIVLFAGTHTYGTTAAARCFVREFRKLRYLFLGDFAAVVKARVVDRHVSAPTLLHWAKIRPKKKDATTGN